jgi:hypothetical protein
MLAVLEKTSVKASAFYHCRYFMQQTLGLLLLFVKDKARQAEDDGMFLRRKGDFLLTNTQRSGNIPFARLAVRPLGQ